MEIKKYYIILIASLLLSNTLDEYTVSWYGIPMAIVQISSRDTIYNKIPATKLIFKTETNNFASKLFKIDNMYQTIIDNSNFNILAFEKITYQPNITNKLYTINSNLGPQYYNTNFVIPKNCFNIFSLLYYLSTTPFEKINKSVKLEREGLIYNCIITKYKTNDLLEFEFEFISTNQANEPLIKHTDIFTWALFKENSSKKITINNFRIEKCYFKTGLSILEANIK
tara:strand:- start:653 stop:1330 length:678 start_codon:yes stop_codon:yes gene_type:complete